jgi:hypothetical protein
VGGLAGAWAVAMGISAWRQVKQSTHLPVPADLLAVTGLFAALALLSDISPAARPAIILAAWGLDVAGLLRVLPAGLMTEGNQAISNQAAAESSTTAA